MINNLRQTLERINRDPRRFRIEKWFWVFMIAVAFVTGLINSVAFVSFLSLYALVLTLAGAEQAAEARKSADEGGTTAADIREELVAHTTIDKLEGQ